MMKELRPNLQRKKGEKDLIPRKPAIGDQDLKARKNL